MEVVKGVWESKSINAECILSSGGVKISVLCRERCTTMLAKKKNLIKVWTEVTFMVQFEFLFSKSGNDGRKSTKEGETLAPYFQLQSLHFSFLSFGSVWKWEQISARQWCLVVKKVIWDTCSRCQKVNEALSNFINRFIKVINWDCVLYWCYAAYGSAVASVISRAALLFYVQIITKSPPGGNISEPSFVWNALYFRPLCQVRSAVLFSLRLDSIIISHPADWQAGHVLPRGEALISE